MTTNPAVDNDRSKSRVLCVDDDSIFLRTFTYLLRICGYVVFATSDPRRALALAVSTQPNLVIVDYQMPHLTGLELAQRMKRVLPCVPIILFSADPFPSFGSEAAIDERAVKGENTGVLLEKIRTLISCRFE